MLKMLPDLRLEIIRWAPVADSVMIEWEGQASVAGKTLFWRGVDRVSPREGMTSKGKFTGTRAPSPI